MKRIRRLFRLPPSERRLADDIAAEIEFHVYERARHLAARGMDASAARAQALREFGDVDEARAELEALSRRRERRTARSAWLSDVAQDVQYGVRSWLRAPTFALLAVLTLALGIGANAAVFSVVKSVLLNPLPYADADRLVRAFGSYPSDQIVERGPLSPGAITLVRERQRSFESMAGFMSYTPDAVFGAEDGPAMGSTAWVEPDFFHALGVPAALGRTFISDDADPDTGRVIVLSNAAWQRLYAGDRSVIGRDLLINAIPRTIIGVLPRDFVGPAGDADAYFPLDLTHYLATPAGTHVNHWLGLVGRLNPGVTLDAARAELAALGTELAREHADHYAGRGIVAMPMRDALAGDTRTPLLVLLGSAALVLLIACANLAGALLARALSRRKEFAVRVALGAGRGRLVRQLLTESTLLSLAGGAVGVLVAVVGLAVVRRVALTALPSYAELSLDGGVLALTALLALATGIGFGLVPALAVGRADARSGMQAESRNASESRRSRRLRGALVAAQIALCVSLLAGAGLLGRSLWAMTNAPLGFEPAGVLTTNIQLPNRYYGTNETRAAFRDRFMDEVHALPGVTGVAVASSIPTDVGNQSSFSIVGSPWPTEGEPFVLLASVSHDYFRTLGITVVRGRAFDEREHDDAPRVVIISESMARRYWGGADPVGTRITIGFGGDEPIEVIGVVTDVRNDLTRADAEPMAYASLRQLHWGDNYLIRGSGDAQSLVRPIEHVLTTIDPNLPLGRTAPLAAIVGQGLIGQRLPVLLMSAFGALALLLASVGVYALFAAMAAARTKEFGVRMALGSTPRAIAGLVLRQGGVWMLAGLAGGALGIVLVVRGLRGLLYGVAPFDPIALGLAVGLLLAAATLALLAPVRRAARVEPGVVLRGE
jgi:putative ABC transport system permease protein